MALDSLLPSGVSPYCLSSSGLRKSLLQVALCSQGSFWNEIPEASSSLLRFRTRQDLKEQPLYRRPG